MTNQAAALKGCGLFLVAVSSFEWFKKDLGRLDFKPLFEDS
jgi:hypothetical protein